MKNTIVNYLNRLKKDRSRQRKMGTVLVCLSLVVAVGVVWSLHLTGESQTAETWCGYTEHQHSEECTEKVLVCGYAAEGTEESEQASAHTHTDECYETRTVLTCGETEHTHSAENGCYDEDGNLTCEIPEHTHTEENGCYTAESVLVCGLEEGGAEPAESQTEVSGHVHTDECYEITYICGFDYEHTHTLSCFSNPEADVETAADWERTFANVELTGDYADDLLAISKTQLGYTESAENYATALDADGSEYITGGYTRYGAWYGAPYKDWCAMFVSFCLDYAKVPAEAFPRDAGSESWTETLSDPEKGYELYEDAADYTPCPGDLVFFDMDEDGKADRVGIVSELAPEYAGTEESYKDDADYTLTGFKVIEGDSDNKVRENEYELADESILGYGRLPENPELGGEAAGDEAGDETRTITADAGDGVTVTAAGKIPEGAYLTAQKLADDQIAYLGEAFAGISLGDDNFAYDIKILGADGEELELGRNIRVTISGLELAGDAEISGYHLTDVDADSLADADAENTAVEELDVSAREDGVTFVTDGFSVMVIAATYTDSNTEQYIINNFDVVFSSGGKAADTDGDGKNDYYVWTATDSAAGHEFVYRVDYTVSGVQTIPAEKFVITLPLHLLQNADGSWADSFDCAYLKDDEVPEGASPTFVYRIEGDYVYIYNRTDLATGESGYIEFSYTTTDKTYAYEDLGDQTPKLEAALDVGVSVGDVISGAETDSGVHADASKPGVNIDTGVKITSTSKQTPTRYTTWQEAWGEEPDGDNYYFVWPIYTVIGKGTQKYDLTLTDTFTDFNGQVLAYKFSGSSGWVQADENGSASVKGLTPTDTTGRYDYVLVSCSKAEILQSLKDKYPEDQYPAEQYPALADLRDAETLEKAEDILFNSGKYTLSYSMTNKIQATVTPADGKDAETQATATKSYTYEVPPYENPVGVFYVDKWGIYHSSSRVYNSEDISSYKLADFLTGTPITGLKYYTYIHGNPGLYTLEDGATGTVQDAISGKYFQKSVTYSLADSTFSLKALTYESGSGISGVGQTLAFDDYDVTSVEWSASAKTAEYDPDSRSWNITNITDFSDWSYTAETGFAENTLYFSVYVPCGDGSEGEWLLAATYDLASGEYTTDGEEYTGAGYIGTLRLTASGASGTITFESGVKGYKIEMSNPFYYTKIEAYPTISLTPTDHVAQILLGDENAVLNDLSGLDEEALTKVAVTNQSFGVISQNGSGIYDRSPTGTDYVSALVKHATLSKRVSSTMNNKVDRQYEISWSVTLKETYRDDAGEHSVPQESGVFYDLLPAGGILDLSTVKVTSSSGTLISGEYVLEETDNYRGSGRTMLKVTINEPTSTSYTLSYTTTHSWDAIKDYGKSVRNSVAYETGNEDIGDGLPDNGGSITDRKLMADLTETEEDNTTTTKKFLFNQTSWSINNLVAANTGLMKQIKASEDAEYSYSTVVSPGGTYSYQVRFANDSLTASKNIMLFDSLEYFHQNYVDGESVEDNAAEMSDWYGTLTGIDCSQIAEKYPGYKVYVSEVKYLNFYQLNGTDKDSKEPNKLGEIYDFTTDDTAKWVELSEYQKTHDDLSGVRAVAVDLRGYTMAAGESVTYTLYMKAPMSATRKYEYESDADYNPYGEPIAKNNIYVSRTAMMTVTDPETGEAKGVEETPSFFHQDFTRVRFRPVGDVLLLKVSANDTSERVSGAAYLLSGTTIYGASYEAQITSDRNGRISFTDVEAGEYTLREISCGSDWLQSEAVYYVTVTATADGVVTTVKDADGVSLPVVEDDVERYQLTDVPRIHASLSFGKADVRNGQPLEGAEFKLYGTSDYGTDVLLYAVSGSDGEVTFADVEMGVYEMVETAAPEGYIPANTVWKVTVNAEGVSKLEVCQEDGTLEAAGDTIYNEPYHTVQFLKKSAYGKDNYIQGIEFTLSGTSDYGNPYEQTAVSTGSLGLVTFDNLEPGVYELAETNTTNAQDITWDETTGANDLRYEPDGRRYTVTVEADGSYAISGLSTEQIDLVGDGNEEDMEEFYIFLNTPENGVLTVTKVWLDNVKNEDRSPTDLDITVSADEPDASGYGGVSITFDASGGQFPSDGGETRKLAYVVDGENVTVLGRGFYERPSSETGSFQGWLAIDKEGDEITVNVNKDGYPEDGDGNLITPGSENDTFWTETPNGGYTLTLYAKYTANYNMKYAVRLYGINADVDENNKTLALTFGPATGEDYRYLKASDGTTAAAYGTSSGYVAHLSYKEYELGKGKCLHWMTWEQIAATNNKAEAFADCLKAGCTHSVLVDLNETIRNDDFDTNLAQTWTGDGAGMFCNSINSDYLQWNTELNYGGWAICRARYTLNGIDACNFPTITNSSGSEIKYEDYKTNYSGADISLQYNNSLLSCFEPDLQSAIVAAQKVSGTGAYDGSPLYSSDDVTTNDKLWLFSSSEAIDYTKYGSKHVDENGDGEYVWTRSTALKTQAIAKYAYGSYGVSVTLKYGLAPCFCIGTSTTN